MKNIWKILFVLACVSCRSDTQKNTKTAITDTVKKAVEVKKSVDSQSQNKTIAEFVDYNDDGDYFLLIARRKNEILSFINDNNDDRSLLRGDMIEVLWKTDTIYIAGDGDTPQQAEKIISVKKLKDGNVSKFRKTYNKPLKYNWPQEESYSKSYLDKLYALVEYYVANTKNEQLQLLVKNRNEINYSIEKQTRGDKEYVLIGIATTEEHHINTVQWLYLDNEQDKLYEYDLVNDNLVEFKQ
ncbi:hypothetical protein [Pedobacter sp. UBA5917]|jgi:hypothetical protein|uniref:hypothetical protein n=1 Tax=Pedobacter sp. UBA5917 TaxID=1947061 RepID=UPI0025D19C65|nr:hypothetical protein [Pedobacter sp. UBA5917]